MNHTKIHAACIWRREIPDSGKKGMGGCATRVDDIQPEGRGTCYSRLYKHCDATGKQHRVSRSEKNVVQGAGYAFNINGDYVTLGCDKSIKGGGNTTLKNGLKGMQHTGKMPTLCIMYVAP